MTAGILGCQYFQVSTRTEGFGAWVCSPATSCRMMQVKVKSVLQHTDVIHDRGLRVLSREGQFISVCLKVYTLSSLFCIVYDSTPESPMHSKRPTVANMNQKYSRSHIRAKAFPIEYNVWVSNPIVPARAQFSLGPCAEAKI